VSTYLNNPLDTIKTRMQSQGASGGVVSAVQTIYQQKGIKGFWAGVLPRVIRVAPGQVGVFCLFMNSLSSFCVYVIWFR
jgi:solute carrier family 25 citrate transporter 1